MSVNFQMELTFLELLLMVKRLKTSLLYQDKKIMLFKNRYIVLVSFFAIFNLSISDAQRYIGISGGVSKGTFMDFTNDENYDAKYHLKNGAAFSSFYEEKIDSTNNFRIELQYKFQRADMEINYNAGHASFYENLNYSLQQLNFNFTLSLRLFEKKSWKMFFLFGPTAAYTTTAQSEGNGWGYVSQTQIDTNGNAVQILTTRNWEKKESKSKDLSQFNVGFDLGLDIMIPINKKLDFIIQNKYNIFLTNATNMSLKNTSLLTGYINLGLRYNISNSQKLKRQTL